MSIPSPSPRRQHRRWRMRQRPTKGMSVRFIRRCAGWYRPAMVVRSGLDHSRQRCCLLHWHRVHQNASGINRSTTRVRPGCCAGATTRSTTSRSAAVAIPLLSHSVSRPIAGDIFAIRVGQTDADKACNRPSPSTLAAGTAAESPNPRYGRHMTSTLHEAFINAPPEKV